MGERDVELRRPRRGSREGGDPEERSRAAFKGRSQERWGLEREWFVGRTVVCCSISGMTGQEMLSE